LAYLGEPDTVDLMKLNVYTDGGSRGNPWNAWLGVFITEAWWKPLEKRYKNLGITTNNVAEYTWALYGIRRAIELWAQEIELFMDSKLVIEQLSWKWKIKDEKLKTIAIDIQGIISDASIRIQYTWIPREENKVADALSNKAMDEW